MAPAKIRNMEEFATVSGISRPTVSKYFNDPESVRRSTRARIEAALERYDYRPNIYAVNQNRRLTKMVGIVVPYLADPFFAELARLLERLSHDAGFAPTVYSAHGDPALEVEILDNLRSLKPSGVLLAPLGRASDRMALERFARDVPTINVDVNIDGMGAAFVGTDHFQTTPLMVDYLCRTGQPPALFEMSPVNPNANKRRDSYRAAMEHRGHDPHVVRVGGEGWLFEEIGYRGGLEVLDDVLKVTDTIFCGNDRLAIGLLAAAYEKGLRVGHEPGCDLRVAGHDDHPTSRYTAPSLTTIAQDYHAIATDAVAALQTVLMQGDSTGERVARFREGRLVMRASA